MEVSGIEGAGKTEWVLQFLAQNSRGRVAWIEEELGVFPSAFSQYGVSLDRVLFVDAPPDQALWSAQQILRSGVFQFLVLQRSKQSYEELNLRKLQLAAEKSNTTVILISPRPQKQGAWPISVQLQVSRSSQPRLSQALEIEVLKCRGEKGWTVTQLPLTQSKVLHPAPKALCQLA